jgi:hypothetical protein
LLGVITLPFSVRRSRRIQQNVALLAGVPN